MEVLDKKRDIWNRTEGHCGYCGVTLTIDGMTIDHVLPKAYGGSNTFENYVAACKPCNSKKSSMTVEQFRCVFFSKKSFGGRFYVKVVSERLFWVEKHEGRKLRGHSAVIWKEVS